MTTSTLLQLLAAVLRQKTLIWDDADKSPDLVKVMKMAVQMADRGFSWDAIHLARNNPESWKYVGR